MNAALAPACSDYDATRHTGETGTHARALAVAIAIVLAANLAASAASAASVDDATLAEVVVTAQRRAENVQDVPASIAVFTPQQLAELRIEQTSDLGIHAGPVRVGESIRRSGLLAAWRRHEQCQHQSESGGDRIHQ